MKERSTIAVFTHWPTHQGISLGTDYSAIAWHTKNTLSRLKCSIFHLVLPHYNTPYTKPPAHIHLAHFYQKGNFWSILKSFWQISSSKQYSQILIQYEFNIFGGNRGNLALLFGLLFARFFQKPVIFEMHQVITDFASLSEHIGMKNKYSILIYSRLLRLYYLLLGYFVSHFVVFEKKLEDQLSLYTQKSKITTLSLPPPLLQKRTNAKQFKNKTFQILMFGYFNWYKGTDLLIDTFQKFADKYPHFKLTVAGTANPYHEHKAFYQKYFSRTVTAIQASPNIDHLGFVEEKNIPQLFANTDLVILPYRRFFAASGPFAHALAAKKPIILSEKLLPYLASSDFKSMMLHHNLNPEDLFFSLESSKIMHQIHKIASNKKLSRALSSFTAGLYDSRKKTYQAGMTAILQNFQPVTNDIKIYQNVALYLK